MCTKRHVKAGKTLLEFPVYDSLERVSDYVFKCQEERLKAPVVGGAVYMQTHSITRELSIIYLLTQKRNLLSGIYDEDTFDVDIRCHPLKEHTKRCMIVPIHGRKLRSLTDKCVCLGCLTIAARKAEKQRKDVVKYISEELLGPISITTVRADPVTPF